MTAPPRKLGIITLGCRLNQHESDSLTGKFLQQGFSLEENPGKSDSPVQVCIVNTCAVTARGEQKSRQALARIRKQHPEAIIIVTGCAVENNQEQFQKDDKIFFVDNDRKHAIAEIAERALAAAQPGESSPERAPGHTPELAPNRFAFAPAASVLHTRASLKVEDGCDNECAYCIVPRVRGKAQSRPIGDCLEAARALLAKGYHEIVITGVNIQQYRDPASAEGLDMLMRALLNLEGDFRLRLSSIEPECEHENISWTQNTIHRAPPLAQPAWLPPRKVSGDDGPPPPDMETPRQNAGDALTRLFDHERLCPHLHLCVQSGSDRVLARMRRRYRAEDIVRLCAGLRQTENPHTASRGGIPGAAKFPARRLFNLTADIIVGFPGESDADFADTLDIVRECGFTHAHAFPFSPRPGSPAAEFSDRLSKDTVSKRMQALRRLVQENRNTFLHSLIGIQEKVLIEKIHADGSASGYGRLYVPVRIPASPDHPMRVNTFVDCEAAGLEPERNGLIARPCAKT